MPRPSRDATVDAVLKFEFKRLLAPMVLSERLFSLHPKIASGERTYRMLQASARRSKAEDMLPIRVARAVNDNDRWTNDFLVVVEKE
jgi:hypothetical protein